MPRWQYPIGEFGTPGIPYVRPAQKFADPVTSADAFFLRIAAPVPGSLQAWDDTGGHLVAFGNACTHMGCALFARADDGSGRLLHRLAADGREAELVCGPCPCHGTSFDLTRGGLVILGPATQDLPQVKLERAGGDLVGTGWLRQRDPREETWPTEAGSGADG